MAPEIWLLFFNERKENPIKIYKVHGNEKNKDPGREKKGNKESQRNKVI